MSRSGSLCLLLHSHMPYVEGFGTWPFGEEWLFEAVASSYLPLLDVLEDAPVTLTVTPVLADQLEAMRDGEAGDRFVDFVRDLRALVHAEDAKELEATGESGLAAELRRAAGDYERADAAFEAVEGDLLGGLGRLKRAELWTSAATHAVLPLLATRAGTALQLAAGIESHIDRFGSWDGGFWLPECAYCPELEADLAERAVHVFCVDQTDRLQSGALDNLEPVTMPEGVVAVPIDWQTICLIWDMQDGYPGARAYRDYHRRTRYDLRPWNVAGEPYRHEDALALTREHARDFVAKVRARLDGYASERGRPGLVCCALDTELLGHWWYEGPAWLAAVLEEAPVAGVELRTISDALADVEPVERTLAASSWGNPKTLRTWDSPAVADIACAQRRAELAVVAAAPRLGRSPQLERAARELLALQSSDWAFQVTRDQAGPYPLARVQHHAAELAAALVDGATPEPRVRNLQPRLDVSPLVLP
ncbi:MAG TPA: 1,4-alpha-glucan branching protein domain-containing protein [Thermoleophilaceae bacterium]|nr:1,4-alpha-glucan branching protein domain-containing protein [Thermoleophilaceae bacterium]